MPTEPAVVVTMPKFGSLGTRLMRLVGAPTHARLRLDELASDAWRLMDGRTVAEVAAELARRHPHEEDLPGRLGLLVSMMVERQIVRLDCPGPGGAEGGKH